MKLTQQLNRFGAVLPRAAQIGLAVVVLVSAGTLQASHAEVAPPAEQGTGSAGLMTDDEVMRVQAAFAAQSVQLQDALGTSWGHFWADERDGRHITIGAAVPQEDIPNVDRVVREILDPELSKYVTVSTVEYSYAELREQSDRIRLQIAATAGSDAEDGSALNVALDFSRSKIVVIAPESSRVTDSGEAALQQIISDLGDLVEVRQRESLPVEDVCSTRSCDPPLRAGVTLEYNATGVDCSTGFAVRSKTDGRLYQLTAGHCVENGGGRFGNWRAYSPGNDLLRTVGPVHSSGIPKNVDAALIRQDNNSFWQTRAWVYVRASSDTVRNEAYRINVSDGSIGQNWRVCMSGRETGTSCGRATLLFGDVSLGGRYYYPVHRATYSRDNGASGGPVYASNTAFGIHSGWDGVSAVFAPIDIIEGRMNVNVSHENP